MIPGCTRRGPLALLVLGTLVVATLVGCEEAAARPSGLVSPSGPALPPAEPIPEAWLTPRVAAAEARLIASDGGRLIWESIEAHGGLATWYRSGTLEFVFDYQPSDESQRKLTLNRVDLWRARAWQSQRGSETQAVFGWDGTEAWIEPGPDSFPTSARFWALTPYYFVGVPFVFADEGTRFEDLGESVLWAEPYRTVKVTFEAVGDAPDDYYILYLHPETKRVKAMRYIVSYPGFFAPGSHSPEKLMHYQDFVQVGGLWLATRLHGHRWEPEYDAPIDVDPTVVTIDEILLGETYPGTLFARSPDAVVAEIGTPPAP